jgi:hypothetical protein
MPPAFKHWLKYNSMYIRSTGDRNVWYPKLDPNTSVADYRRIKKWTVKDYVERYIIETFGDPNQGQLFQGGNNE